MASWSEGYVTDVSYTRSFFKELAPSFLDYVCVVNGVEPPPGSTLRQGGGFTYCELACGNGVSTNLLAAGNPQGEFHGIDFMPAHIATARKLASDGKADNISFHEISFEESLERSFPQFDYIVLHGIYSWVSARNRANILSFIQKNLKSGGVVYVSYNTLPGWASIGPFQNFALEYSQIAKGDSVARVKEATNYMRLLKEAGARVFQANPHLTQHMSGLDKMPAEYLAHEYLNQDWHPIYVTQAIRDFTGAKCDYVGSATLVENHLAYVLSDVQRQLLGKLPTRELRELVKDYLVNQRFRRDVYARGGLKLSASSRDQIMGGMTFALDAPPAAVKYQARVPVGQISFDSPVSRALVKALSAGPQTLKALTSLPEFEGKDVGEIVRNIQALAVTGQVRPVAAPDARAAAASLPMRKAILERVFGNEQLAYLPSGNGTAFALGPLDLAMLAAPGAEPRAIAEAVHARMSALKLKVMQGGKPVDEETAALAQLEAQAKSFLENKRPWLAGLGLNDAA